MPNWPFERANPLGWSSNAPLSSAQLNKIDANQAQAANGIEYTDVAQLVNLPHAITNTNGGRVVVHHPILDAFLSFNVSASNPVGRLVRSPFESVFNLTLDVGAGLTPEMVMLMPPV